MRQLKRRIEKLESEQQPDDYSVYYCLVGQGPPPPKGSYYDVALSVWFEGLSEDD